MLGPTGLKEKKRRTGSGLGSVFLSLCVFTQLWLVVSGVIYSGIDL